MRSFPSRVAALMLLVTCAAHATDVPLEGKKLSLRRSGNGSEKLVLVVTDPDVVLPLAGSLADPLASSPGAILDVVSANASPVGAFVVPWGAAAAGEPGWTLGGGAQPTLKYRNPDAPDGESVVTSLVLKQGKRLKIVAKRVGVGLAATEGTVGVRLTFGKGTADEVRLCTQFGGTITRDEADRFQASNAPQALADCSDAALATFPTLPDAIPLTQPSCGPGFDGVGSSTAPGTDLRRVTLHGALELCNDGSPAVFYIRPATPGGGHEDDWLIWLEGGGGCRNAVDCAERWCGVRGQGGYGAHKMSSLYTHLGIRGNGIFRQTAANRFKDWNMVVTYYCSSDNYVGRHTIDVEPGTHPGYKLAFNGQAILMGMLDRLRDGVTSDDGLWSLPPIPTTARVLFTGTSGGGEGAIMNTDRAAAWAAAVPVATFQAAIDARVIPGVDDTTVLTADDKEFVLASGDAKARFSNGIQDDSCVAWHAGDDLRMCSDPTHVLLHHVAVPFYVHQDLGDPTAGPAYFAGMAEFTAGTRTLLETQFLQRPTLVEEPSIATAPTPTVFAPLCDHHVGFESAAFYDNELQVAPDPATDINTTLADWFDGLLPPSLIDDVGGAVTSGCL
jgi:hypothetical protein